MCTIISSTLIAKGWSWTGNEYVESFCIPVLELTTLTPPLHLLRIWSIRRSLGRRHVHDLRTPSHAAFCSLQLLNPGPRLMLSQRAARCMPLSSLSSDVWPAPKFLRRPRASIRSAVMHALNKLNYIRSLRDAPLLFKVKGTSLCSWNATLPSFP